MPPAGRTSAKDPEEASAPHQDPLAIVGVLPHAWPAAREHGGEEKVLGAQEHGHW